MSVYGRLSERVASRNVKRSPTCPPARLSSCSVSEYIAPHIILLQIMRLSLKMLFHWVCKRTADYPRSQARGLNGLESLGGSLDFGGDPSLVPYDNLNPWDYGSSGCVSTGHLSLGESASGSSNYW